MSRRWVEAKKDIIVWRKHAPKVIVNKQGVPEVTNVELDQPEKVLEIPKGSVGFIKENAHMKEEEGHVQFLMSVLEVPEEDLQEADMPSTEQALEMLKEFKGHHCSEGQYQFNIKMYGHWEASERALQLASDEEINAEYYEILENELRCFVDKEYCDSTLVYDFPWIDKWWTAGRMGGWLVLTHKDPWYDADCLQERWEELQQEIDSLEVELNGASDEDDYIYARKGLEVLMYDLAELETEIKSFAMEISFIANLVRRGIKGTFDYLNSEEAWERLVEQKELDLIDELNDSICPVKLLLSAQPLIQKGWEFKKTNDLLLAFSPLHDEAVSFKEKYEIANWVEKKVKELEQ